MQASHSDQINYLSNAVHLGLYTNERNLSNHLNFFFQKTPLCGKRILDIGGGSGLLSFWTAVNGASAICIEPECEGSTRGMQERFWKLRQKLGVDPSKADLEMVTFQNFESHVLFDVIVLANSINHLNESATEQLLKNKSARDVYVQYFRKMRNLLNNSGKIIITDCDRSNFFNAIGLSSPFMRTIEWHKHQSPYTWKLLLEEAGFTSISIKWSSPNTLGRLGQFFLGNRLVSYFLFSHFRIEAVKR